MSRHLPRVGTLIDATYRLDAVLGEGGAGAVFRATHLGLQKPFALKVLLPPPGANVRFFERFRVEAETLGRLSHPGIVRVTDFGVDTQGEGLPYLVMELVEGSTLDARCSDGPIPLPQAAPILEHVAAALDAAHDAGVVHGDLTTRNVMVTSHDGTDHPVIIDFGLAQIAADDAIRSRGTDGTLTGTAAYMAPELAAGGVPTPASDIYAFGVLAYRTLTGQYPFPGSRAAALDGHATAPPPAPSSVTTGLPSAVDDVVLRALAKSDGGRPASASEISRTLSSVVRQIARRSWFRSEIPRRAAAALLVAIIVTALQPVLGSLGFLRRIEGIAFDTAVRWSSPRQPDARLLLVSFDDRSLAADATPLPDRADEVGGRLNRLMAAGVGIVAVDLLLPAHWSESREFAELVLEHAPRLALAVAQEGQTVVGPESIAGLISAALGPDAARAVFASVNVEPDLDGVVRSARLFRITGDGTRQPTLAARIAGWPNREDMVNAHESFPIDYRLERRSVERISWVDLDLRLRTDPHHFENRLVLVGAEFAGSGDRHLAPRTGGPPADITGLEQQALIAATVLAPGRFTVPRGWRQGAGVVAIVMIAAGVGLAALLRAGAFRLLVALAGGSILWTLGSMMAFAAGIVLPVAVPLAQLLVTVAVTSVWSRRLSSPPARA
ncbi:MAG TPA: protein kinase [Vicinamibacterales bacterium]|nr:protein kinase [Vicinamibacterales bacterium]